MVEFSQKYMEKATQQLAELEAAFAPDLQTVARELSEDFKNAATKQSVAAEVSLRPLAGD